MYVFLPYFSQLLRIQKYVCIFAILFPKVFSKGCIYMDELSIYEKNLSQLLDNYEKARVKYINDLRIQKGGGAPATVSAMASLNQEIMFLMEEISSKINKINNDSANTKYADEIDKKKSIINVLNAKMRVDGAKINALLNDTINLDGKNESIRLQQKTNLYYLTFYTIFIIILGVLFIRIISSSETDLNETVLLLLGLVWLFYTFRDTIIGYIYSIISYLGDTSYSWLARILN